ncbi:hypothetical protein, partial [Aliarcobacter butzleri]|uniref:hypothetical protein n=1 Tax=Aliarcobacter butzleri TaxID=28197 RepID=UPI0021B67D61
VKISGTSGGNFEALDTTSTTTVTVKDDEDPVEVTITATVTTPKIIDVDTKLDGTTGVKITGYNSDGAEVDLSIISGTNHDGFGIDGKNLSNGDTKELGMGEKIVVEFTGGKDVNSLDVSFAWRNNHETAKLTFIKDGQIVGYATVSGDGSSTTKAFVKYYDENNKLIREVNAKGSSDKVDEAFTFELPDSNGGIVSFDKVEFSAPTNVDDYLINKIVYKEVIDPTITDIKTDGGNVTFNIQIDEKYPPQGKVTATVEVNGIEYKVPLNATGRGTLTIDSKDLGDLSKVEAKVIKVEGGNYEKVNTADSETKFDFTSTHNNPTSSDDNISTDEDTAYTLKVTDFGDVSANTKEFKITELPGIENGKLYIVITKGETIFNKDGSQTIATEDSKVEVSKGQVISLAQVGAEQVVFEPTANSDADGSFKFQVGDGKGNFSSEYTTTIEVKAVADAPDVSISITPSSDNSTSPGSNGNGNSGSGNTNFDKVTITQTVESSDNNPNSSIDRSSSTTKEDFTFANINSGTKTISTGSGNDEIKVKGSINGITISTGSGNDYIKTDDSIGNNSKIHLGDGNDTVEVYRDLQGTIEAGAGDDRIIIGNNVNSDSVINTGSGNDYVQINSEIANNAKINLGEGNDGIRILQQTWNTGNSEAVNGGAGFDTLYLNGNHDEYLVYIKSTDTWVKDVNYDIKSTPFNDKNLHVISWETYAKLNEDSNGEANREFYIMKVSDGMSDNKALKVTNFESIAFGDGTIIGKEETSTVYKYDITVSATLTDTDGSESLSKDENGNEIITLKNIPVGSTLYNGEVNEANKLPANDDGSYTVKIGENGKAELSLTNEKELFEADLNSIKASATSNEVNEKGEITDSATSTVDNILGTDISLDNLSSIISENGEINLANSKAENISLTLDDVIKLSGDDNVIKISGDNFDSVTFKDTVGENGQENNWSKVAGTDTDQGYDIYTNSGDPTIQVKVEQPISDGITN